MSSWLARFLGSHFGMSINTGSDAPTEFSVDPGMPVNRHGLSEVGDAMDAGSSGIDNAPTQQSAAMGSIKAFSPF